MPRNTNNHEYSVPVEGDTDYQSTFNSWFDTLDQDIEIRDVESNLTNYQPYDGAKFIASDSGKVFYGDGNSWTLVDRQVDELTATSVNTERLYSKDRQPTVVVHKEGSTITAISSNGVIDSGSDASTVLQSTIDWMASNESGTIYIKEGVYDISSQVTVDNGAFIEMDRNALLKNQLSDDVTFFLAFNRGAKGAGFLNLDANGQMGVRLGEKYQYCGHSYGEVLLKGAGYKEDFANGEFQYAIGLYGFDHTIGHIGFGGGQTGIDMVASDVFGRSIISVNSNNAFKIAAGSGHIYITNIDIESYKWGGLEINGAHDVHLPNVSVWLNTNAYNVSPDHGVRIGNADTASGYIGLNCFECGPSALEIGENVESMRIDALFSNYDPNNAGVNIQTAIEYLGTPNGRLAINANFDPSISTFVSGTPSGVLNGVGYEASGASNSPTAGNWPQHRIVENTDDNTLWMKDATGTMRQVI
jgi:hypothetical protein